MARLLAASVVLLFAGPAFADDPDNESPPPVQLHGANAPINPSTPAGPSTSTPPSGGGGHHRGGGGGGRNGAASTGAGASSSGRQYVPATTIVGNDGAEGGPAPHTEGAYGGVAPDQTHPVDATHPGKPKHMPSKGTLTWIGFEAKDGGAEVFFQSVAPFAVTQGVEGSTLVVLLSGLTRQVVNTRRPIDTHFFDNPLASIKARTVGAARATKTHAAHSAGVEVRIAFKNPKDAREATLRSATEADGMSYAYLTFPEGADAPAATAPTMANPER